MNIRTLISIILETFIRVDEKIVDLFKRRFNKKMNKSVNVDWKKDKLQYLRDEREMWRIKRILIIGISIPYSLISLLIYNSKNEENRLKYYRIASFVTYISLIWSIQRIHHQIVSIDLSELWSFSKGSNTEISILVWAMPFQIFLASLLYKIDYILKDFMKKSADEIAIDLENEEDDIKMIYEKGER